MTRHVLILFLRKILDKVVHLDPFCELHADDAAVRSCDAHLFGEIVEFFRVAVTQKEVREKMLRARKKVMVVYGGTWVILVRNVPWAL